MNGPHDLGGMHGLGPINPEAEKEEPLFHAEWEKRALGLTLTTGFLGQWNIDISRHARERQHPIDYLSNSYYENWMAGVEKLLVETGLATQEEIETGKMQQPVPQDIQDKRVGPDQVAAILDKGGPCDFPTDQSQTFQIGDRVRVKMMNPTGHTRAPRYVRGHVGEIVEYFGSFIYPDENSKGNKVADHLYNVKFDGKDIWGPDGDVEIHVDLWRPYLEKM
ncbi:nitrile hydratase subunit beta [Curvivirga aplysinae]|uniref:nitrile hydratase subunit beta n=1 Tax=Curvivirga aplysinae TaxID=2529852 RepID=UPI0012BD1DCF|nr:nitrile hydratase subunit beta [Curvivirga aplysinae]MTI11144.1 nitrile hydratase subunit beta [Curvivirga aplysinae]